MPDLERIDLCLDIATRSRLLFPRHSRRADSEAALEANELQVLMAVLRSPDDSTRAIARRLALDQSTVSMALTALLDRGLVVQDRHESDGRRRRRTITRDGQQEIDRFLAGAASVLAGA